MVIYFLHLVLGGVYGDFSKKSRQDELYELCFCVVANSWSVVLYLYYVISFLFVYDQAGFCEGTVTDLKVLDERNGTNMECSLIQRGY